MCCIQTLILSLVLVMGVVTGALGAGLNRQPPDASSCPSMPACHMPDLRNATSSITVMLRGCCIDAARSPSIVALSNRNTSLVEVALDGVLVVQNLSKIIDLQGAFFGIVSLNISASRILMNGMLLRLYEGRAHQVHLHVTDTIIEGSVPPVSKGSYTGLLLHQDDVTSSSVSVTVERCHITATMYNFASVVQIANVRLPGVEPPIILAIALANTTMRISVYTNQSSSSLSVVMLRYLQRATATGYINIADCFIYSQRAESVFVVNGLRSVVHNISASISRSNVSATASTSGEGNTGGTQVFCLVSLTYTDTVNTSLHIRDVSAMFALDLSTSSALVSEVNLTHFAGVKLMTASRVEVIMESVTIAGVLTGLDIAPWVGTSAPPIQCVLDGSAVNILGVTSALHITLRDVVTRVSFGTTVASQSRFVMRLFSLTARLVGIDFSCDDALVVIEHSVVVCSADIPHDKVFLMDFRSVTVASVAQARDMISYPVSGGTGTAASRLVTNRLQLILRNNVLILPFTDVYGNASLWGDVVCVFLTGSHTAASVIADGCRTEGFNKQKELDGAEGFRAARLRTIDAPCRTPQAGWSFLNIGGAVSFINATIVASRVGPFFRVVSFYSAKPVLLVGSTEIPTTMAVGQMRLSASASCFGASAAVPREVSDVVRLRFSVPPTALLWTFERNEIGFGCSDWFNATELTFGLPTAGGRALQNSLVLKCNRRASEENRKGIDSVSAVVESTVFENVSLTSCHSDAVLRLQAAKRSGTTTAEALAVAAAVLGIAGKSAAAVSYAHSLQSSLNMVRMGLRRSVCPANAAWIGTDLADNPLRLDLGVAGGEFAGGAIVGNTMMLVVIPVMIGAVASAMHRSRKHAASSNVDSSSALSALMCIASWFLVPTVVASVALLIGNNTQHACSFSCVVIALFGLGSWATLPLVLTIEALRLSRPFSGRLHTARRRRLENQTTVHAVAASLCDSNSIWKLRSARRCNWWRRVSQQLFSLVLEGCKYPFWHMVVADQWTSLAEGVVSGIGLSLTSCSGILACAIVQLLIAVANMVVAVGLRPRSTPLDTHVAAFMAVLSVLVGSLALANAETAAEYLSMFQSLVAVVANVVAILLACLLRRHQPSPVEASGPCGKQSTPWATRSHVTPVRALAELIDMICSEQNQEETQRRTADSSC